MKVKKIVDNTTNRGEFNRAYKEHLVRKGRIRCSYCRYHKNENGKGLGSYGGLVDSDGNVNLTYPSWKLVSKNRKQWMRKPIKMEKSYYGGYRIYIDIIW